MSNTKLVQNILWLLVLIYAVVICVSLSFSLPVPIPLLLLVSSAFVLIHGAVRYRWSGIIVFIVTCLVISNILENLSILTGFPFGHYYYTDLLGAKLFLVPLVIGPAYYSTGYLAWVLSTILIGDIRRGQSWFLTFATPFIASFLMVAWDLCFDPTFSTLNHRWIWEQGGGYFGVPLTNYLGWFFTVYVFFQLFALFLRFRKADYEETRALPTAYYAQAITMYAIIGLTFVLDYLVNRNNTLISDAVGVTWHSGSITEAEAIVSIYTMIFIAIVSAIKLFQRSSTAPGKIGAADETATQRSPLTLP